MKGNEYCMICMNLLEVYLLVQLHLCVVVCQNGEGLCKCLLAFEVLSVQMIALKLSEMH